MDDAATVELMLASQSISRKPCVVHFFAQDCPGCKAMHPKLNQIIRNNSDFKFIKVRLTERLHPSCSFRLYILSAVLRASL